MIDICMALDQPVSSHTGVRTTQNTGVLNETFREQFIFQRSILKHYAHTEKIQRTFPVNYISKDRAAFCQYFLLNNY